MVTLNELLVIGSESILSLYPILIKAIPTTLPTQIFSRLISYSAAGGLVATKEDIFSIVKTPRALARTLGLGLLTCLHIYVSYVAFSSLSAGVAMSLFYTYPLWNIVGAKLLFNETIHTSTYYHMAVGVIGTYFLSTTGVNDEVKGFMKNSFGSTVGVVTALLAALTESAMYFAVKTTEKQNPWSSILELYGGALVFMIPVVLLKLIPIEFSLKTWAPMVLFNLIVGFIGYALRFYTIPKVPTEIFGLLSYTGVLSAFVFGYLFMKEKPSYVSIIGAIMVAYAASQIEAIKSTTS
jgi:drug/metabolite transporter (DMT)-like permease